MKGGCMRGIGLDFGTTNSTLAVFDGRRIDYIKIDLNSSDPTIMPTALYFNRDLEPSVGTAAIENYIDDNEGRIVRLTRELLGDVEVSYGELGMVDVAMFAMVDRDMPGQLFRGLKRWLGYEKLEVIKVLHKEYRSVALITPILEYIKAVGEKVLGKRIDSIHVGRPVHFEGLEGDPDATAVKRLAEACQNAGFDHLYLYPEPLGASLGYLHSNQSQAGEIILTFDFGGGTLDLSLIWKQEDGFDILATHGTPIGGDKMDREIYRSKIFPELGHGAMVKTSPLSSLTEQPFRFFRFTEDLLNWNSTHTLNTVENMRLIDNGIANTDEISAGRLRKLKNLISLNCSYSVHKSIEKAKIELSDMDHTVIEIEEIDLEIPIHRREFEALIQPLIREMDECIDALLDKAGVNPDEVDLVVRTGGSSLIPLVKAELESRFPGKIVEYDVFQSIAAGLAIANYNGYEFNPS